MACKINEKKINEKVKNKTKPQQFPVSTFQGSSSCRAQSLRDLQLVYLEG